MLTLFTFGYIIPLIIMFLIVYYCDDVLTVRDLLNWWWAYLIPALNVFLIGVVIIDAVAYVIESRVNKNWWNNFLDRKL